ncbi:PREDICTED: uncharacterized protein LOC105571031, partial [Vollenhovia emeryi]|uniref:uncharacterized protein LOC105571031 n=1 Tax=Vollenhovia emeryi TaxID=411798 RepID=UPI0005F49CA1
MLAFSSLISWYSPNFTPERLRGVAAAPRTSAAAQRGASARRLRWGPGALCYASGVTAWSRGGPAPVAAVGRHSVLFSALQEIFGKLADNAEKYSTGASSNVNESLNATMASKAPKSRCTTHGTSASADFRFACAVGQKNIGECYTQEIAKTVNLSPGRHHSQHVSKVQKTAIKRRALITSAFKKRRMALKKLRTALRYRKENSEGVTYESNCALLSEPTVELEKHYEIDVEEEDINDENAIILLDLETSGLEMNCDILQIGAKYNKNSFSIYINPVRDISENATRPNGLTNSYGELLYHGTKVQSVPIRAALLGCLQDWLTSLGKRCYITTHNLTFDGPRLLKAISKYGL